jgi:hypothetical protein
MKKKSSNAYPKIKDKAWKAFSLYIRLSESDKNGIVECYTCGTKLHYKDAQAGHYHHGRLDFDERNVHCQCIRCNHFKSGNLGAYAERLTKELGIDGMDKLRLDANQNQKYEKSWLKEMTEQWNIKIAYFLEEMQCSI